VASSFQVSDQTVYAFLICLMSARVTEQIGKAVILDLYSGDSLLDLAGLVVMLMRVFCVFPPPLQENDSTVRHFHTDSDCFLPNCQAFTFMIIAYSHVIRSHITSAVETASLNNRGVGTSNIYGVKCLTYR
jgi:hypothetical protein